MKNNRPFYGSSFCLQASLHFYCYKSYSFYSSNITSFKSWASRKAWYVPSTKSFAIVISKYEFNKSLLLSLCQSWTKVSRIRLSEIKTLVPVELIGFTQSPAASRFIIVGIVSGGRSRAGAPAARGSQKSNARIRWSAFHSA